MNEQFSRSEFLRTTAMAGAAVLLSSMEGFALERPQKTLRVAIIGCGSVSNKYDRAVNQNNQYMVGTEIICFRNHDQIKE